ncbi:MAG: beta-propeller fold lactonase family protein, partial [Ktedonobacterales bacterium]
SIGSQPGDVLFNGNGTRLAGTRVNTSLVDSFVVGDDGQLSAASGSPYPAPVAGPFGSAFRPGHPNQLFVSLAHGGAGNGAIEAYDDARDGSLTPIGASPYADLQTAPCWVDITPNGRYLFALNTGSGSFSSFAIGEGGTLTLIGSTALRGGSALKSFDIRVSPDGRSVYVVDAGGASVSAFHNDDGILTELAASPISLPAGATPFGIVAD